jgi:hypothetical protein
MLDDMGFDAGDGVAAIADCQALRTVPGILSHPLNTRHHRVDKTQGPEDREAMANSGGR